MPNGFFGGSAIQYLSMVENALSEAEIALRRNPFETLSNWAVPPPRLSIPSGVRPSYRAFEARDGSGAVGKGSSDNIVLPNEGYRNDSSDLHRLNYDMSQGLYDTMVEIENLCETSYRLPQVVGSIRATLASYRSIFGEYRSLTDETVTNMSSATDAFLSMGGGSPGNLVWNSAQAEAIRDECESNMQKQERLMRDTAQSYGNLIPNLETQAMQEGHIAQHAMGTVQRTNSMGNSWTALIPDFARRQSATNRAESLREQIMLLNSAIGDLTRAANKLGSDRTNTKNYFQSQHEELKGHDSRIATKQDVTNDATRDIIRLLDSIANSIDDAFPKYGAGSLLGRLQASMSNTAMTAMQAANLAGIPAQCALGGDPVNMSTGNFIYFKEDITVPGSFPLVFKRFYNALGAPEGTLGKSWIHNFHIKLLEEEKHAHITFDDGHIESYEYVEPHWVAPRDSDKKLVRVEDKWRLFSFDGTSHWFDNDGLLYVIADRNGNQTELFYQDEHLTRVETLSGHLEFDYEEERLITITDHTGRKVKLEYDNNLLTKVTHPTGATHEYCYGNNGLLTEIVNPLGVTSLTNEYDDKSRMSRQQMADGGVMGYKYDEALRTTTYTQQNGSDIRYEHDEKYRTIGIAYPDGEERREYNHRGQVVTQKDKNGNVTKFEYDDFGHVAKIIDPLNYVTQFEYDAYNLTNIKREGCVLSVFAYDKSGNIIQAKDALDRTAKIAYDETGQPTKVIAPDESVTAVEYDARGNIATVTDSNGGITSYEYDELNQVVKAIRPKGDTLKFSYNATGDISEVTNAEGNVRRYEYNASGKITKVIDFDGGVIRYKHNDMGRVEEITDQAGGVTRFTYDLMWNVTSVTNPCGATVKYEYDKCQRIIRTIDEEGNATSYNHDPNGNVTAVTDATGAKTQIKYDALDRQKEITEADGAITKLEYDNAGNITKVTDALGNVTIREYDLVGQLTTLTDSMGNTTRFEYSPLGQIQKITNAKGESQILEYYLGGNLKSVSMPCSESESYEYDKNDNVVKVTDSAGNETKLVYDALDRVTEIINALGYSKKFGYDANSNITSITDELGNITRYKYSLLGDVIEVIDALGHSTKYEYDKSGRLTKFEQYRLIDDTLAKTTQMEHQITTYERNKKGEVISVTSPLGDVVKYKYDKVGNVISKLDEDNLETLYNYNLVGELEKVIYADGKTVELSYNSLKQLTKMKDWLGITTIKVDELGRTTKVTDYEGKEVGYSWNELNQKEKLTYPDGSEVKYSYNLSGGINEVISASGVTKYTYDTIGMLTKRVLPDGTTTKYESDSLGRLMSLTHIKGSEILDSFKYSYDPVGNITQIDKQRKGVEDDSGLFQYDYDSLSRLIEATHDSNTKLYNYDNLGNRVSSIQNGLETRHSYNSRNQLIRTEGINTKEYLYDKRGNLTQITENGQLKQKFTFDTTNMMTGVFTQGKGNAQYTYNGFRNRVKKLENLQFTNEAMPDPTRELRYTLDMTLPYDNLLMTRGSENQNFIWGDSLLEASGSHHYLQDHLGSPIRLLGNDAKDTALAYDEFGVPLVGTDETNRSSHNPFGFTGYQTDDVSGLYYAQARYYTPQIGRFTAIDTYWHPGNMIFGDDWFIIEQDNLVPDNLAIGQAGNLYNRCLNNPLGHLDSLGLCIEDVGINKSFWDSVRSSFAPRKFLEQALKNGAESATAWTVGLAAPHAGFSILRSKATAIGPNNSFLMFDRAASNSKVTSFGRRLITSNYTKIVGRTAIGVGAVIDFRKRINSGENVATAAVMTAGNTATAKAGAKAGAKFGVKLGSIAGPKGMAVGAIVGGIAGAVVASGIFEGAARGIRNLFRRNS